MADRGRSVNSANPFYFNNTDDVDDYSFLNHPKQGSGGYMLGGQVNTNNKTSQRQQQLYDEINEIQERSLRSTQRSLGLVHESEEVGVAAAVELVQQREQLQNAERKVDDINQTLKLSQRNINSMKSIFGGIKSYFSKSSDQPKQMNLYGGPEPTPSKLTGVIESSRNEGTMNRNPDSHPAMKARGLDTSGFFADDDDLDQQFMGRSSNKQTTSRFKEVEEQMDRNLDDLSSGITRLKGLATGLGQEIEEQNEILDRLSNKVDKADLNVSRQNKQMNYMLR